MNSAQVKVGPELDQIIPYIILNKGTGAGGANTNYHGKKFEEQTNNESRLLAQGYSKQSISSNPKKTSEWCLSKTDDNKTITFVQQSGLKLFMKRKYNIEVCRCPDEAYIIEFNTGRRVIKILEKKEQNVEGSVIDKLLSGPSFKREYELVLGSGFEVHYAFCVSSFLKTKLTSGTTKFKAWNTIFNEHNIVCLFGDDNNYFETLDSWLNNSL
jgi:hypothetical protein